MRGRVPQTDARTRRILARIPQLLGIQPAPRSCNQSFHWPDCPRFRDCLSAAGALGWPGMDCRWCEAYEMTKQFHKAIAHESRWRDLRFRRDEG